MPKKVLIIAGTDFVGSRVADELLKAGYAIRVLDNLAPQVQTLASIFGTRYIL
jgi:dTDP-L-rhamnose 4-epimerase